MRIIHFLPLFAAATLLAQQPQAELKISGDVPTPVTLHSADLSQLPHETASVPEQDGTRVDYRGVELRDVLKRAGIVFDKKFRGEALTTYVVAKAHDGYQVVFTLGEIAPEFGNQTILIADKRDGKSLFEYQGPLRLICPNDKAGARSVRMLESLEIIQLEE